MHKKRRKDSKRSFSHSGYIRMHQMMLYKEMILDEGIKWIIISAPTRSGVSSHFPLQPYLPTIAISRQSYHRH